MTPQDPSNRRGTDPVAELEQLALDPRVSPAWVLARHPHHQGGDNVVGRWSSGSIGVGPSSAHEAAMPAQDRVRGGQAMAVRRSGQPPDEGGEHGPVRPVQVWSWVGRRRTATSWRSTRSSMSLLEDVRHDSRTSPSTCQKIKYSIRSDTSGGCPTGDYRWLVAQDRLLAPHRRATRPFNAYQADRAGFYLGDKVFALADRGKVELFDLLKVDDQARRLYVIHVKKGFAAKMRDVCSQLRLAADVISADQSDGKPVLNGFYDAWSEKGYNKSVDRAEFLSWFDYEVIYVVLCATPTTFEPDDFEAGRLQSHIARREILALKHDMKTKNNRPFHLAHTRTSPLP